MLGVVLAFALGAPSAANAAFSHVVEPGESLSSVAAADGLSVDQLAAVNGLSPEAGLVAGTLLAIPAAEGEAAVEVPASEGVTETSSGAGGGYVVQPGDTLSAIAARAGTSVESLAAMNGLDPEGLLLAGSVVTLPGVASASSGESTGVPSAEAPPYPTEESVAPPEVGSIAAENGVPSSFAEAIANQESGFNNALTSSADARGEMQILPGTWSWISRDLAGSELDPASASSNVRGGVLMLHWLLNETEGDPGLAAAGYFQGLESVRQNGMLPETEQYVSSVLAQQERFGGE